MPDVANWFDFPIWVAVMPICAQTYSDDLCAALSFYMWLAIEMMRSRLKFCELLMAEEILKLYLMLEEWGKYRSAISIDRFIS
jgi:hypothetical protein